MLIKLVQQREIVISWHTKYLSESELFESCEQVVGEGSCLVAHPEVFFWLRRKKRIYKGARALEKDKAEDSKEVIASNCLAVNIRMTSANLGCIPWESSLKGVSLSEDVTLDFVTLEV